MEPNAKIINEIKFAFEICLSFFVAVKNAPSDVMVAQGRQERLKVYHTKKC